MIATVSLGVFMTRGNHAPICPAKTVVLNGLPSEADISSIRLDPIGAAPACRDPDGDSMRLVSTLTGPQVDYRDKLKAGKRVVITFTVADNKGAQTTSTLTLER